MKRIIIKMHHDDGRRSYIVRDEDGCWFAYDGALKCLLGIVSQKRQPLIGITLWKMTEDACKMKLALRHGGDDKPAEM